MFPVTPTEAPLRVIVASVSSPSNSRLVRSWSNIAAVIANEVSYTQSVSATHATSCSLLSTKGSGRRPARRRSV
jgi:hypothetical protein